MLFGKKVNLCGFRSPRFFFGQSITDKGQTINDMGGWARAKAQLLLAWGKNNSTQQPG